jgi:hypothetical protein
MKPRHAATLALLGWYLMVPPPYGWLSPDAPIAQWKEWQAFDTATQCEAAHDKMIADGQKTVFDSHATEGDKTLAYEFITSQCVEADDPRLRK